MEMQKCQTLDLRIVSRTYKIQLQISINYKEDSGPLFFRFFRTDREESHRWPHECLLTGMLSLTLSRSKANVASDATWIVLCDVPGLHIALKDNIASKICEKGPHEICRVRWSSRDPCWCPWQCSREGRFKQQPWMQKLNNSRKNECHGELEISHKWLRYMVL